MARKSAPPQTRPAKLPHKPSGQSVHFKAARICSPFRTQRAHSRDVQTPAPRLSGAAQLAHVVRLCRQGDKEAPKNGGNTDGMSKLYTTHSYFVNPNAPRPPPQQATATTDL